VVGFLLYRMGYRKGLIVLAAILLAPLLMGLFAEMNPDGPPKFSGGGVGDLLSSGAFWLVSLAFMFYVPLESGVAGWATTLIARQFSPRDPEGAAQRMSSMALSGFWLCFMGSRLVISVSGAKLNLQVLLTILACASLALMMGVVFLRGRWPMALLVVAAGLVFGPIFPALITLMFIEAPPNALGRAVGLFFFFASCGWTAIPMLIGSVAKRTHIQRGFLVAAASSVVFLSLVVIHGLR
jgi:fucose permease